MELMSYETGFIWGVLLVFALFALVPFVLFLLTQHKTVQAIRPENRTIEPGLVWLQLIPLFGIIWQFIVVSRISDSLQREFMSWRSEDSILGYTDPEAFKWTQTKPTYSIGIAYCTLSCCSIIPLLGGLAALAALVCWIVYWVNLADYKRRVSHANHGRF